MGKRAGPYAHLIVVVPEFMYGRVTSRHTNEDMRIRPESEWALLHTGAGGIICIVNVTSSIVRITV